MGTLWRDAAWGMRDLGVNMVGPADPFSAVLALVGSLWPGAPSTALVLVWLLALPLAVLGGWFAATRVTERPGLRVLGGIAWALAPTFLTALVQGRPSAVLFHLLLPWVFHTASVAHRSWGAAGAASVVTAAALACAPSVVPAVALLWVLAIVIALAAGQFRGAVRLVWVLIPTAVMFAPLGYWQFTSGDPAALFADPAVIRPWSGLGADAEGRSVLATGFPSEDRAGWTWLVGTDLAVWAPVLLAPVLLLALAAALSPRWRAGITLLVVALAGMSTAFLAVGVVVSFAQGAGVQIWPGTGLSLAWIGVLGAALVTADTAITVGWMRTTAALTAGIAVAVCAIPALAAVHAGQSALRDGPASTLPAFVAAQSTGGTERGTLVLTPLNDGSLSARVVWGSSDTLDAQTTMLSTATVPSDAFAVDVVDLISARDFDAATALASQGISFVLLATVDDEGDRARTLRTTAAAAIDRRESFVGAGQTERGTLWRIDAEIDERPALTAAQRTTSRTIAMAQVAVVLATLLLSIPTQASRRAARARPRVVGRAAEEPLVLPRRRDATAMRPAFDSELMSEPDDAVAEPAVVTDTDAMPGETDAMPDESASARDDDAEPPIDSSQPEVRGIDPEEAR